MPATFKTLIDESVQRFNWTRDEQVIMKNYMNQAGQYLQAGNTYSAGQLLIYYSQMYDSLWQWQDTWYVASAYKITAALYWINDNWPSGAVVTMAAILSAMLTAKFDQLQSFIGIEDAYRVALWNAPFNVDFYAALARGFMKW